MMYLKRQEEQGSVDDAPCPSLDKQLLPTPDCSHPSGVEEALGQIEVGCVYEIDNTNILTRTPFQLKSVRMIMVSEKTEFNVSVSFPSMFSLHTYFGKSTCEETDKNTFPELDEKFIVGSELAAKLLMRKIPAEELAEKRNLWSFWSSAHPNGGSTDLVLKKGKCWSELKFTGMVQWGKRRRVAFIGRHNNISNQVSSSAVKEEETGGNEEAVTVEFNEKNKNRKREPLSFVQVRKTKAAKHTPKTSSKTLKKMKLNNSKDRWSVERYKLAEKSMLEIMKAKGAVFENPVLRPELRAEARKFIGDTGLLDHLLKHMAGKVAPGGTERFRRRHNADGAMEYWLERADLVDIRREAGVEDPYWTPPPGWEPGDNPTQDPICARELKLLKEEMAHIRRVVEELASKKKEDQAVVAQSSMVENQTSDLGTSSLLTQEIYKNLVKRKAKIEQQLMHVSSLLKEMEPEIGKLTASATVLKSGQTESAALMESTTSSGAEKEQRKEKEEKAAKRQRLKSGFRICKPQGTFLWPNMAGTGAATFNNNTLSSQVDLLVVPTPPSVSSTSVPPRPFSSPHPTSPVKPFAEKRVIAVTVSTVTSDNMNPTTTPLPNLNDPPTSPDSDNNNEFCGTTTSTVPSMVPPTRERNDLTVYSQAQTKECTSSCLSAGGGTWLALATPDSSLSGNSNRRG